MVHLTIIRFCQTIVKESKFLSRKRVKFVDSLRLHVVGGRGGNGVPQYRGIGGNGSNIVLVGKDEYSLSELIRSNPSKKYIGSNGKDSKKYDLVGSDAPDFKIPVPIGVTVYSETGAVLGYLNKPGDSVLVARGGQGGNKTNAYLGRGGEALNIHLDLKLLADVGLVGFPNAGKSSLLRALSRAKPKVANYPFTTLKPNLGIIEYEDLRKISVADLPGLIEGAHANVGLGHRFLRHVERTQLLLLVVDITGFRLKPSSPYRTAFETLLLLNKELELYQERLMDKPAILVVNKIDTDFRRNKLIFEEIRTKWKHINQVSENLPNELKSSRYIHFQDIIPIVAARAGGIPLLKDKIREVIDFYYRIDHPTQLKDDVEDVKTIDIM